MDKASELLIKHLRRERHAANEAAARCQDQGLITLYAFHEGRVKAYDDVLARLGVKDEV